MMPDFIEQIAIEDLDMKLALALKATHLMTPIDYDTLYEIPSSRRNVRAMKLVHLMYKTVERDPSSSYGIKSVLTRAGGLHKLVFKWEEAGKLFIFWWNSNLYEVLFCYSHRES